jgi:hypothetical protein
MAKVLIGCETSGIVREAFLARGHDAWSCDLLPSDTPTNRHIVGDVRDVMRGDWDLMAVMHPPCTRLCNSGVRWLKTPPPGRSLGDMWRELDDGAALFSACWNADHIPCVAVENPVMHRHAKARIANYAPPAQTVQPWQFGTDPAGPDNERKRTCFWLRALSPLVPTGTLDGTTARDSVHRASPGAERWKQRSRFFPGLAAAMADQWGAAAEARRAAAA